MCDLSRSMVSVDKFCEFSTSSGDDKQFRTPLERLWDVSERDLGVIWRKSGENPKNWCPTISINRLVYDLVYYFPKTSTETDMNRFPDLISESGSPCQRLSRENTQKTIRDGPVHTTVRSQTTGCVIWRDDFPELFWGIPKSSDWSQSLISWSLEELEGSISV